MRWISAVFIFVGASASALVIPRGLSQSDRIDVVETLGLGAAPKLLSNPYPLGGYSGFEIGYSVEFINVRDLNRLGCAAGSLNCANTQSTNDDEFVFSRITVGKGLYRDVDVFFSFAPPIGGANISDYGGLLRWAFYQAEFLPITFSAILHGNRMNVQDEFVNQNIGTEIMVGVTVDNFAFYFGGGEIWSRGTFLLQGTTVTDSSGNTDPGSGTVSPSDPANNGLNTFSENTVDTHMVVGMSAQYDNLFGAAEIDHYRDSVYSMKAGMRF